DQFMRQSPLPFPAKDKNSPKEYDALAKDGKAKGFSFGLGADQKAAELGRGVVDDLSLAKRTLGSEHGRALMNELNGTKFDRLLLHSNGATVGEALIRKGVIQVDTLHIAGGDRSLINGGLQELLDTGKVKKIVVWINPGDPVPIASANAVSAAAELYHEGNQWIVDTVTGMKRPSKGAQVEYRVLKGDEYQGQHLEGTDLFQAHHLTTYVANMRVYYRNHPTED
ncbi:MAG TPA: hypothetical protein VMU54_23625, partial [Planctomycetota bacterium]|nr:hypothetical protein [Planctomycetota bacterium]